MDQRYCTVAGEGDRIFAIDREDSGRYLLDTGWWEPIAKCRILTDLDIRIDGYEICIPPSILWHSEEEATVMWVIGGCRMGAEYNRSMGELWHLRIKGERATIADFEATGVIKRCGD
jgi:hypothetical protein